MSDELPLASKALHTSPVAPIALVGPCAELAGALSPLRPALSDPGEVDLDAVVDPAPSLELVPEADADAPLDVSVGEAAGVEVLWVLPEVRCEPPELRWVLPEVRCEPPELRCVVPELCWVVPELCGCVAAELLWAGCQALPCTGAGLLAGAEAGAGAEPPVVGEEAWPVPLPLVAPGSAAGAAGGLQP